MKHYFLKAIFLCVASCSLNANESTNNTPLQIATTIHEEQQKQKTLNKKVVLYQATDIKDEIKKPSKTQIVITYSIQAIAILAISYKTYYYGWTKEEISELLNSINIMLQ